MEVPSPHSRVPFRQSVRSCSISKVDQIIASRIAPNADDPPNLCAAFKEYLTMLYATSYNILTNTAQDIEPRSYYGRWDIIAFNIGCCIFACSIPEKSDYPVRTTENFAILQFSTDTTFHAPIIGWWEDQLHTGEFKSNFHMRGLLSDKNSFEPSGLPIQRPRVPLSVPHSEHVMGGYKFLMRYYSPGDEIFIGFSRGPYRPFSSLKCWTTFTHFVVMSCKACLCSPDTELYINRVSSFGPLLRKSGQQLIDCLTENSPPWDIGNSILHNPCQERDLTPVKHPFVDLADY